MTEEGGIWKVNSPANSIKAEYGLSNTLFWLNRTITKL